MEANHPARMNSMLTAEIKERHDEAGHPAPAVTQLEELEAIDPLHQAVTRHLGTKDDRKDTGGAGEVPLPFQMSRACGKCRMQDGLDVLPVCQPSRDGQTAGLELLQAHGQ